MPTTSSSSRPAAAAAAGDATPDVGQLFLSEVKRRVGDGAEYRRLKGVLKENLLVLRERRSAATGPEREAALQAIRNLKRLLDAPELCAPPSLASQLLPLLPTELRTDARRLFGCADGRGGTANSTAEARPAKVARHDDPTSGPT